MLDVSPKHVDPPNNMGKPLIVPPSPGSEVEEKSEEDFSVKRVKGRNNKEPATFALRLQTLSNKISESNATGREGSEAPTKLLDEEESSSMSDESEISNEGANVDVNKYVSCWDDASSRVPIRKDPEQLSQNNSKRAEEEKISRSSDEKSYLPQVINSEVADLLAGLAGIDQTASPDKDNSQQQSEESVGKASTPFISHKDSKMAKKSAFNKFSTLNETHKQLEQDPILKNSLVRSPSTTNVPVPSGFAEKAQQEQHPETDAGPAVIEVNYETDYPSVMQAEEPVARPKHLKIVDFGNAESGALTDRDYVESENEVGIRAHFKELRDKEKGKKHREKKTQHKKKRGEDPEEEPLAEPESKETTSKKPKNDKGKEEEKQEDGDEGKGKGDKEEAKKEGAGDEEDPEDENGSAVESAAVDNISVASTETTSRIYQSVRAAIDEKFVSGLIGRLNGMTIGLLLVLLAIAITIYIYQRDMYANDLESIKELSFSEKRKEWLIDINLRVRTLLLLNMDASEPDESQSYIDDSAVDKAALQINTQNLLKSAAVKLREAQSELSLKTAGLSTAHLKEINPDNVMMIYRRPSTLVPYRYTNTIWQTALEIIVASYRVANMTVDQINLNQSSVFLIAINSLNSVYMALEQSTEAIATQIDDRQKSDTTLLLILLIIASGAILGSSIIFLPAINNARCCKERVLMLFTELEIEEVKDYQSRCEKFKRANASVKSCLISGDRR